MTRHDDTLYVGHMVDLAMKARELVGERDREQYDGDETLQFALVHLIQTIGEAARHVSVEGRAAQPEIPWHRIIGMRHRIVHDYFDVDTDIVWEVVSSDLAALIATFTRQPPQIPPK